MIALLCKVKGQINSADYTLLRYIKVVDGGCGWAGDKGSNQTLIVMFIMYLNDRSHLMARFNLSCQIMASFLFSSSCQNAFAVCGSFFRNDVNGEGEGIYTGSNIEKVEFL